MSTYRAPVEDMSFVIDEVLEADFLTRIALVEDDELNEIQRSLVETENEISCRIVFAFHANCPEFQQYPPSFMYRWAICSSGFSVKAAILLTSQPENSTVRPSFCQPTSVLGEAASTPKATNWSGCNSRKFAALAMAVLNCSAGSMI